MQVASSLNRALQWRII